MHSPVSNSKHGIQVFNNTVDQAGKKKYIQKKTIVGMREIQN